MRPVVVAALVVLCFQCAVSILITPDDYCGYNPQAWEWEHFDEAPFVDEVRADLNLVHASVLIRHGDRTPVAHSSVYGCWPSSPVWTCEMNHQERPRQESNYTATTRLHDIKYLQGRNYNPGNCGQGRLTTKGYLQQIHNGQVLRNLYMNQYKLLPQYFQASNFFVRATDVPRTQLSAESLFQGLYPFTNASACLVEKLPIFTMDTINENMYPNPQLCPALSTLQKEWENSPVYQSYNKNIIQPLLQQLSPVFKIPVDKIDYNSLQDCFQAHACHQFQFPTGMTQDLYKTTIAASTFYYKGLMNFLSPKNNTWVSLAMGQFVADIVEHLDEVIAGTATDKVSLYSAHDTTLMPWLAAYGIWDGVWPPYASVIRIQLYQDNSNNFFVQIYYNDQLLTLPGCSSTCPYFDFRALSFEIITAFSLECTRSYVNNAFNFGAN